MKRKLKNCASFVVVCSVAVAAGTWVTYANTDASDVSPPVTAEENVSDDEEGQGDVTEQPVDENEQSVDENADNPAEGAEEAEGAEDGEDTAVDTVQPEVDENAAVEDEDEFVRGDANGDGVVNAGDVFYLKRALAGRGGYVINAACDANDDGAVNVEDVTFLQRAIVNVPGYELEP